MNTNIENDTVDELKRIYDFQCHVDFFANHIVTEIDEDEPFFEQYNRDIVTSITMIAGLGIPEVYNRQVTIEDIKNYINDFSSIIEIMEYVENKYANSNIVILQNAINFVKNELVGEYAERAVMYSVGLRNYMNQIGTYAEIINFKIQNNE